MTATVIHLDAYRNYKRAKAWCADRNAHQDPYRHAAPDRIATAQASLEDEDA